MEYQLFDFVTAVPTGKMPRKGWKSARQGCVIHIAERFIKILGETGNIYHCRKNAVLIPHPFAYTQEWMGKVKHGYRGPNDWEGKC